MTYIIYFVQMTDIHFIHYIHDGGVGGPGEGWQQHLFEWFIRYTCMQQLMEIMVQAEIEFPLHYDHTGTQVQFCYTTVTSWGVNPNSGTVLPNLIQTPHLPKKCRHIREMAFGVFIVVVPMIFGHTGPTVHPNNSDPNSILYTITLSRLVHSNRYFFT